MPCFVEFDIGLPLGATDRRVFRGLEALHAPVSAPGDLASFTLAWAFFLPAYSKIAKLQI